MGFQNLLDNAGELVQHMRDDGHSENYIRRLETEIRWLARNGDEHDSYESACIARQAETGSPGMRRHYRLMFGILMRFDLHGEFPDYRMTRPLFAYGSRRRLEGEFAETIASFEVDARRRGLEESTIRGDAANASRFLLAMSERGLSSLSDITEEDVLLFFADDAGNPAFCCSYAKNVRTVLTSDLGPLPKAPMPSPRSCRTSGRSARSSGRLRSPKPRTLTCKNLPGRFLHLVFARARTPH